uniref:DUF38 domain-containing protein n=1 Tax=Panagrolaimus superbus TaxID=310955 RepID=A0A914Y2S5_9BILA
MFPHQALDDVYQFYERYSTSAPSTALVKRYQEMKKLYAEIEAVEDDVEQWLAKVMEVDDKQFIIHNIEYRLGGNLLDLKLWKLYLEYLRKNDPKEMLQAYSKYCRFFIDDKKMLEEYKHATAKFGPINVSWKNPFDFEKLESQNIEPIFDLFDEGYKPTEKISFIRKQPCRYFFNTENNYIRQNFSLPNTVMHYIHQTANHVALQKLYKSCKYFFAKKSTPICYKFDYTCSPRMQRIAFREQSIDIRMDQNGIFKLQNLFIANSLSFYYLPEIKYQTLSTIIQSFERCEPKHLTIENQNLTFAEFKFLAGHGNIETLHFKNVRITNDNREIVPLEDIVVKLPKVYELCLDNILCTSQTSSSLLQIKFKNKFKELKLHNVNDKLELNDFYTFLWKNVNRKTCCTFSCSEEASEEFILEFQRQYCCLLDFHFDDSENGKPMINIFSAAEYELFALN